MKALIICPHCSHETRATVPFPRSVRTCRSCKEQFIVPATKVPKARKTATPKPKKKPQRVTTTTTTKSPRKQQTATKAPKARKTATPEPKKKPQRVTTTTTAKSPRKQQAVDQPAAQLAKQARRAFAQAGVLALDGAGQIAKLSVVGGHKFWKWLSRPSPKKKTPPPRPRRGLTHHASSTSAPRELSAADAFAISQRQQMLRRFAISQRQQALHELREMNSHLSDLTSSSSDSDFFDFGGF